MEISGWTILVVSWSAIISLCVYCLWRSIKVKPQELTAPLDVEAGIEEEEAAREINRKDRKTT